MLTLFVDGTKVGTLADAATLIPRFAAQRTVVEFRDEAGDLVATFIPAPGPTGVLPDAGRSP